MFVCIVSAAEAIFAGASPPIFGARLEVSSQKWKDLQLQNVGLPNVSTHC